MTKAQAQTTEAVVSKDKEQATAKAILKAIGDIKQAGTKLQDRTQEAGLEILAYIEAYGQDGVGLANALVEALPGMARANALKQWFIKYGKMTYSMKKKMLVYRADFKTDIKGATAEKFWNTLKEADFKPFKLEAQIHSLIKRAEKAFEENDERNQIDPDLLAKLKKLA